MVFEMALLLCLGQPDTLSQANFQYADGLAEAGIYESWESLIDARNQANIAGFGSISRELQDGSYALEYVFRGSDTTINSQLDRLNQILGSNYSLKPPPIEPPSFSINEEESKAENVSQKEGYQINVSSNFEKTKIADATAEAQKDEVEVNEEVLVIEIVNPKEEESELTDQRNSKNTFSSIPETINKDIEVVGVETKSKERKPLHDEADFLEKDSVAPLYAIVFGSFKNRANAERFSIELEEHNIQVDILDSDGYYRVLIPFEEYPTKELKSYHELFPRIWLLRND